MTAARVSVQGILVSVAAKPADTNEATLFTAGEKGATLVQLVIANNSASPVAATVQWNDGSTDWDLYVAKSIAANDSLISEPFIHLPAGGSIKVTSGTGAALIFSATLVEKLGAIGGEHGN